MGEAVVADHVASLGDFADDVGKLTNVAANEEKSGVDVVLGEKIKKALRVRVVGAVIVGEGKLTCKTRVSDECSAVPLAGGRHGLVAGGDCGSRGSGGDGEGEHEGIVNCRVAISD